MSDMKAKELGLGGKTLIESDVPIYFTYHSGERCDPDISARLSYIEDYIDEMMAIFGLSGGERDAIADSGFKDFLIGVLWRGFGKDANGEMSLLRHLALKEKGLYVGEAFHSGSEKWNSVGNKL